MQVLDRRQEREAGLEQLRKELEAIALSAQGGFPWDGTRAPYPGLLAFEEEDAPIYFGRDDDIRHLIERLRARSTLGGANPLVLLGASGSGKPSLLRAGAGRGTPLLPDSHRRHGRRSAVPGGDDLLRSEFLGRLQVAEKNGLTARFKEVSLAPMPMVRTL